MKPTMYLLATLVLLATSCGSSNNSNEPQPEWLYVQTAETAQMTSDTTLEIPVTLDIFGFTDRPNRQHGYFTAAQFASLWDEERANNFLENPPNAVLTWLEGEQSREVEMILNSATVSSDGAQESLVYGVTLETDEMPDAEMSYVSLFVDSGQAPTPAWSMFIENTNSEAFDVSIPIKSSTGSTTTSTYPNFKMPAATTVESDSSNIVPQCWVWPRNDDYPQCTYATLAMTGVGGLSFSITDSGGTEYKYSPDAAPGEGILESQWCSNSPPKIVDGGSVLVEIRQAEIGYGVTVVSLPSAWPRTAKNPDAPVPASMSSCQASLLSDYDEWENWCINNKVECVFAAGASGALAGVIIGELAGYAAGYLAEDATVEISQQEAFDRWVLEASDWRQVAFADDE